MSDKLISEIIKKGTVKYTHHYCQTMTSGNSCEHFIVVPKPLETIVKSFPFAEMVEYGDGSLGIEINGKLWAAELPDETNRPAKKLTRRVWQYLTIATGGNGDTNQYAT